MEKPEYITAVTRRTALGLGLGAAAMTAFPGLAAGLPPVVTHDDQNQVKSLPFHLKGRFLQSGYTIGQAAPGAEIWVDGVQHGTASQTGNFYVGLDRDAPVSTLIEIRTAASSAKAALNITPQTYDIQHVDGLPQQTVTPTDPDVIKRIEADIVLKNAAFTSRVDADWFKDGFAWPLDTFIISGHFGNQRVLNGKPASPHMGFDMAAPTGTPIHAPQKGLVILAEPDLFFEGGLILIDHGQGLISMYLHQSKLIAKKGDIVTQGQLIGEVGAKGRATGPHLCWRLKWGDRHMDPSLMVV